MQDFRRLVVWEKAHCFTLAVYRATASFPSTERFGLAPQIRRAAASIPSNIAEACGRHTDGEYVQSIQVSFASASEVEYQLLLARDLAYLDSATHERLEQAVREVKQMLAAMLRTLRRRHHTRQRRSHGSPDA